MGGIVLTRPAQAEGSEGRALRARPSDPNTQYSLSFRLENLQGKFGGRNLIQTNRAVDCSGRSVFLITMIKGTA